MPILPEEPKLRDAAKTRAETPHPKKRVALDLEGEYENAVARPYNVHSYDADLRSVMESLVQGYVRGTLRSLVRRTVKEHPQLPKPSPDNTEFARAMTYKFPKFAAASEITGLSMVMRGKEQEAYYSEHVIAEYMCELLNKRMRKYGVTASIEANAIVLNMTTRRTRIKVSPQLEATRV